jgi:hypothetical protein
MDGELVVSSNLRSVGYDPSSAVLEIEFGGGGVYQYFDVPESVYLGLMNAASKGGYLQKHVKGHYRYKRVGG